MFVETIEQLEAIYCDSPVAASKVKELDHISDDYAALIAASPFVAFSTCGPEGLDCSPRGDTRGFVRVVNPRTLAMPDRRGNNRIDSLRNIMRDKRVALLFLIPGSGTTFRVNGTAMISTDPDLLSSFAVDGKPPKTVIMITVQAAYLQCARAIVRSRLWDESAQIDQASLPSPGAILDRITTGEIDGKRYDDEWPDRARRSLW